MPTRIAHLSDLHLLPKGTLNFWHLFGRRAFGAANLLMLRRHVHSEPVARAAVQTVLDANVDYCVVTGDVCNLALDSEFALALDVLAPLRDNQQLTVIPGNHDYYTPESARHDRFGHWFGHTEYPMFKDIGDVRIIGLRSSTFVPPLCAYGRLGPEQLQALARLIDVANQEHRFPIVALHHNLHVRSMLNEFTGRLMDRDALKQVLRDHPPGLVIHGHDHHEHEMTIGQEATIPVIGCGSSSILDEGRSRFGRLNIYTIDGTKLRIERWRYLPQEKRFQPQGA